MGPFAKVAAGAASLQFQCIICFDDFNLTDRTPMVLPCGHTYVCHACTQRLNRCMECRQPLFLSVPSSAFTNAAPSGLLPTAATLEGGASRFRRYGNHAQNHFSNSQPPPPSIVKIPLSIPKNVVLISLMEAAQRQLTDLENQDKGRQESEKASNHRRGGKGDSPRGVDVVVAVVVVDDDDDDDDDDTFTGSASDHEVGDDEELKLDRAISGISALSESCGTYAVTVDGAVVVQSNNPRPSPSRMKLTGCDTLAFNDSTASFCPAASEEKKTDDLLVAEMLTIRTRNSEGDSADDREESLPSPTTSKGSASAGGSNQQEWHNGARAARRDPFVLRKGQTLQVVSIENRVAKLARDMGYIVLGSSSHLVKVSGPIETSCWLEGLLDTIQGRGRDLQAALDENRHVEIRLMTRIVEEKRSEPRHPVITDLPVLNDWCNEDSDDDADEDRIEGRKVVNGVLSHAPTPNSSSGRPVAGHPSPPSQSGSVDSIERTTASVHAQSPVSIDNADLRASPVHRRAVSEDDLDQVVFGCGIAFLGDGSSSLFSAAPNTLSLFGSTSGDFRSVCLSSESPFQLSRPGIAADHCSQAPHDYAGPPLPTSVDGINFRTGMSGHRGLNHLASKPATSHLSPTATYRNTRLMSEHRGIARPSRRELPPSSRRESPPPPHERNPMPASPSETGLSSGGVELRVQRINGRLALGSGFSKVK